MFIAINVSDMITQSRYADSSEDVNSAQKQITEMINAQSKMKKSSAAAQITMKFIQHEQNHARVCRKSKNTQFTYIIISLHVLL